MDNYIPPFKVTDSIVTLVAEISECVGAAAIQADMNPNPRLRKENRIKTIQASLAIENNSLTLSQVTAIINGKRVLGPPGEIKEVQNAFQAYELLLTLNPLQVKDLLKAHKIMMSELVLEAGDFRSGGVGIFAGEQVIHMAPSASMVPELVDQLIGWYIPPKYIR